MRRYTLRAAPQRGASYRLRGWRRTGYRRPRWNSLIDFWQWVARTERDGTATR